MNKRDFHQRIHWSIKKVIPLAIVFFILSLAIPHNAHASDPVPGVDYTITVEGTSGVTGCYTSLQNAWSNANTLGSSTTTKRIIVKLFDDFEIPPEGYTDNTLAFSSSGTLQVTSGHHITLDLNGHNITRSLTEPREGGNLFTVNNGGDLLLTDSSTDDVSK